MKFVYCTMLLIGGAILVQATAEADPQTRSSEKQENPEKASETQKTENKDQQVGAALDGGFGGFGFGQKTVMQKSFGGGGFGGGFGHGGFGLGHGGFGVSKFGSSSHFSSGFGSEFIGSPHEQVQQHPGQHPAPVATKQNEAIIGSSYGGSTYSYTAPAPYIPCSQNYIVYCGPSVSTLPCTGSSY